MAYDAAQAGWQCVAVDGKKRLFVQEADDYASGDVNLPKSLKYQACSGKRLRSGVMDTPEAAWEDLERQQVKARQQHAELKHSQAAAKDAKLAARMQSQQMLATAPCGIPEVPPCPKWVPTAAGLSLPMSDDVGQGHQRATAYGVTEGYKMLMSGRDMGGVTRADALATPAAPFAAAAASCALPPGLMGPAGTVVDHISGLLGMQLPPALLLGPPAHAPSGSLLDQVHSAGPPSGTATAHHFPPRGSRSPGAAFGSPVASVDRPATAPGTSRLQTLSARLHALCAHRQAQHTAGQVQDGQGLQEWLQNPAAVPMHQHQPAAWALDSSKVSQHPWADSPNRSSSLMAGAVGSHLISSSQAQHVDIMDVDESVGACAGACEPAVQLQLAAPGAAAGRSGPNSAAPSSAAEPKVVSKSRPPLAPCNGRAAAPTAARAGGKGSRKGEKAPPPRWR